MTSDKQIDHVARIATALERIALVLEEIQSDGIDIKTLGEIGLCVVDGGAKNAEFALRILDVSK